MKRAELIISAFNHACRLENGRNRKSLEGFSGSGKKQPRNNNNSKGYNNAQKTQQGKEAQEQIGSGQRRAAERPPRKSHYTMKK